MVPLPQPGEKKTLVCANRSRVLYGAVISAKRVRRAAKIAKCTYGFRTFAQTCMAHLRTRFHTSTTTLLSLSNLQTTVEERGVEHDTFNPCPKQIGRAHV